MRLMRALALVALACSPLVVGTPAQAEERHPVAVVSLFSPMLPTANSAEIVHLGNLKRADTGEGLKGVTFDLAMVPDIGPVRTVKVTTLDSGGWYTSDSSAYSMTVRTYFPGDATDAPAFAKSLRIPVAPTMRFTSPTATTTRVNEILRLKGSIFPAKPGSLVTLARYDGTRFVPVATTRIVGNFYQFGVYLPHGRYTLKAIIGRTNANFAGSAAAISAIRV